MPSRSVPTLSNLCIGSIAVNVVRHSRKMSTAQPGSEIYHQYKRAQFLYSDDILRAVEDSYWNADRDVISSEFRRFGDFLFQGKENYSSRWNSKCLKFLFNEFTTRVSLQFPQDRFITPLILDSLVGCQNLKLLALKSCRFSVSHLLESISWKRITKLDLLLSSCTDIVIMHLFNRCPNLQELRASGELITDRCLLHLCGDSFAYKLRSFCHFKGTCCDFGKNLKKIHLYSTLITEAGVACALQHLPLLEEFLDGDLDHSSVVSHLVPLAIQKLREQHLSPGFPVPSLKLKLIATDIGDGNVTELLQCCPSLLNWISSGSTPVHRISIMHRIDCNDLYGCVISARNEIETDLTYIVQCIEDIEPKKVLSLEGKVFQVSDEDDVGYNTEIPEFVRNIEALHLRGVIFDDDSVKDFFTRMLSEAGNVESLILSGVIAENCFMYAMQRNSFAKLKEVYFHDADLGKISLKRLVTKTTRLQKISYWRCRNIRSFVEIHKEIVDKANVDIAICDDSKTTMTRDAAIDISAVDFF